MIWMGLLMTAPLWGIGLFFWFPTATAVLLYATLLCASLFLDWLMMGAMHLPVARRKEGDARRIGSGSFLGR